MTSRERFEEEMRRDGPVFLSKVFYDATLNYEMQTRANPIPVECNMHPFRAPAKGKK